MLDKFKSFFEAGGVKEVKPSLNTKPSLSSKALIIFVAGSILASTISSSAQAGLTFSNGHLKQETPVVQIENVEKASPLDLLKTASLITKNEKDTSFIDPISNRRVSVFYGELPESAFETAVKNSEFEATYDDYKILNKSHHYRGWHEPSTISLNSDNDDKPLNDSIILMSNVIENNILFDESGKTFQGANEYTLLHEMFHVTNNLETRWMYNDYSYSFIGATLAAETSSDLSSIGIFEAAAHQDIEYVRNILGLDESYNTPESIGNYLAETIIKVRNTNDYAHMLSKDAQTDNEHFTQVALAAYPNIDVFHEGMSVNDIYKISMKLSQDYVDMDFDPVFKKHKASLEAASFVWESKHGDIKYPFDVKQRDIVDATISSLTPIISDFKNEKPSDLEIRKAAEAFDKGLLKLDYGNDFTYKEVLYKIENDIKEGHKFWNNLGDKENFLENLETYVKEIAMSTEGVEGKIQYKSLKDPVKIYSNELTMGYTLYRDSGNGDDFINSLANHFSNKYPNGISVENDFSSMDEELSDTGLLSGTGFLSKNQQNSDILRVSLEANQKARSSFEAKFQAKQILDKQSNKDIYEPN